MSIYLKNIKIKNFRCWKSLNKGEGITLNTPAWGNSKGLNIFIGDNNSGKTSIISALAKLGERNVINDDDKFELSKPVTVTLQDSEGVVWKFASNSGLKLNPVNTSSSFDISNIDIIKDNRTWKSEFNFNPGYDYNHYHRDFLFDRTEIDHGLANRLDNLTPIQKRTLNQILREIYPEFSDWEARAHRNNPYISYKLDNGKPLSIDYSLGNGLLSLFRIALALVDHKSVLIIDEPEAFLHPLAQIRLSKILARRARRISKDKDPMQIIISTHSPYMFQYPLTQKSTLFLFKNNSGDYSVTNTDFEEKLLFGTKSPTWGEINYYAYNLPTVEFHNELYGYLQQQVIKRENNDRYYKERDFDKYIEDLLDNTSGTRKKMRIWKDDRFSPPQSKNRTLQTYVRNCIHHPENTLNKQYDEKDLKKSTEQLICLIKDY